jgi:hypothetical protein
MKRIVTLMLLVLLSVAASMPAQARTKTPDYYGSQSKAAKQQRKMLKKEAKQQRKEMKRYLKEQQTERAEGKPSVNLGGSFFLTA